MRSIYCVANMAPMKKSAALLKQITSLLDERKAEDIVTISLRGKAVFAEYMVIATATSRPHARALSRFLLQSMSEAKGNKPEGLENSDWIVLDLLDVVVHIFLPPMRRFYRLEQIWQEDFDEPNPCT